MEKVFTDTCHDHVSAIDTVQTVYARVSILGLINSDTSFVRIVLDG